MAEPGRGLSPSYTHFIDFPVIRCPLWRDILFAVFLKTASFGSLITAPGDYMGEEEPSEETLRPIVTTCEFYGVSSEGVRPGALWQIDGVPFATIASRARGVGCALVLYDVQDNAPQRRAWPGFV